MKKVLFSFAMMAAAAMMVSCGNKSAQNAENAEAQDTETVAEEQPAEEAEPEDVLSTDAFSMKAPENFKVNGKKEFLKKNHEISFMTNPGVVPTLNFKINHDANIKFDTRKSDIAKLTAIDPIKVGNVTFEGGWQPDGKSLVMYADLGDKGTARVFFPKPAGYKADTMDDAAVVAKLAELLSCLNFK